MIAKRSRKKSGIKEETLWKMKEMGMRGKKRVARGITFTQMD